MREVQTQLFRFLPAIFGIPSEAGLSVETLEIPSIYSVRDAVLRGMQRRVFYRTISFAGAGNSSETCDLWDTPNNWSAIYNENGGVITGAGLVAREEDALLVDCYLGTAGAGASVVTAAHVTFNFGRTIGAPPAQPVKTWSAGPSTALLAPNVQSNAFPVLVTRGFAASLTFAADVTAAVQVHFYLHVLTGPPGSLPII